MCAAALPMALGAALGSGGGNSTPGAAPPSFAGIKGAREPLLEFTWHFRKGTAAARHMPEGIHIRIGPWAATLGVGAVLMSIVAAMGMLEGISAADLRKGMPKLEAPHLKTGWFGIPTGIDWGSLE